MGAVRARSSWLLWFGVALAPVAALLLAFGQGTSPLRIAAVLALVAVVLIGLSVVLRPEPAEIRDEITDDMQHEVDQVRDEVIVLKRDIERSMRAELERVRTELAQRQPEPIDLRTPGRAAVPAKQRNMRETERVARQDRNTRDTDRVAVNGRPPARNANGTPAGSRGSAQVAAARASVNGNRPEGDRPANRPISGSPISPVSGQTQPMPTIDTPRRGGGRASVPPPPAPPAVPEPAAEPRRNGRAHVGGPDANLASQLDSWLDSRDKGARQSPLAQPSPPRRKQEPPAAPKSSSRWSSYQVDNGADDPLFGSMPPAEPQLDRRSSGSRHERGQMPPAARADNEVSTSSEADPYDPEATQPYDPPGPRRRRRAAEEPPAEDTGYSGGRRSAGSHSGSSYGSASGRSRSSRSEVLGRHSQSPPASGRHSRGTDSY